MTTATESPVSGEVCSRNGTSGSDMKGVDVESSSEREDGETEAEALVLLWGIYGVLAVEMDGLSAGVDVMARERENEHVGRAGVADI